MDTKELTELRAKANVRLDAATNHYRDTILAIESLERLFSMNGHAIEPTTLPTVATASGNMASGFDVTRSNETREGVRNRVAYDILNIFNDFTIKSVSTLCSVSPFIATNAIKYLLKRRKIEMVSPAKKRIVGPGMPPATYRVRR